MFLDEDLDYTAIARQLNERQIAREGHGCWDNFAIHRILTHPRYKGCCVFNRASQKLRSNKVHNPSEQWIVQPNGIEPIVSEEQFHLVQEKLRRRVANRSDEELLDGLRELRQKHGRISVKLITDTEGLASWVTYRNRFGSLRRAYELVGYHDPKDVAGVREKRRLLEMKASVVVDLVRVCASAHIPVTVSPREVAIRGREHFRFELAKCVIREGGGLRWQIKCHPSAPKNCCLVVRLAPNNHSIWDYCLLRKVPQCKRRATMSDEAIRSAGAVERTLLEILHLIAPRGVTPRMVSTALAP